LKEYAVFRNPVVIAILDILKPVWVIDYVIKLMNWDRETYLPTNGLEDRVFVIDQLSLIKHRILMSNELETLVRKALKEPLNDFEKGVVRLLLRDIRFTKSIPLKVLRELNRVRHEARRAWEVARARSDYAVFKPYLDKLLDLQRLVTEYLDYEHHPYDALLDLYEEGLNTLVMDSIVNELRSKLVCLVNKLRNSDYVRDVKLIKSRTREDLIKEFITELLTKLGLPLGSRARIDFSKNIFMIPLSSNDVRIIIKVTGDLRSNVLSTLHEFGHALYELLIDQRLSRTPIAVGASVGIHEGIAKFWDSVIGRSRCFLEWIRSVLLKYFSELSRFSNDDLYLYFNQIIISPTRVLSDEVTNNIHMIIRYEVEKRLIEGSLSTDELPQYWSDLYDELLGVRPKDVREGVLHDIHWSLGYFGYLPTYLVGNLVATQLKHAFESRYSEICNYISNGGLDTITAFLRDSICRWGATYSPKELLERAFGEYVNPKYLIDYLETKYLT